MSYYSYKDDNALAHTLVKINNDQNDAAALAAGKFHRDITGVPAAGDAYRNALPSTPSVVSAANASDLPSLITLNNQLVSVMRNHFGDDSAHKIANGAYQAVLDGYGAPLAASAPLATVIPSVNAMKVVLNLHMPMTTLHLNADNTNTVSAANATDQASANTLANALKASLNAHMASGPTTTSRIRLL
jgi:hypothetical protein